MVQYYNLNALPILGGRQVFIQFSQYKELKMELTIPTPNGAADEANSDAGNAEKSGGENDAGNESAGNGSGDTASAGNHENNGVSGNNGSNNNNTGVENSGGGGRHDRSAPMKEGHVSPVLRVIVEHMIYPITLDTLTQIFKKFGTILKLITFTKNNTFQALIQYDTQKNAESARVALNGQNVYTGCCSLKIDYSKLTSLNVKYNNEKSRDFTNPTLPSG